DEDFMVRPGSKKELKKGIHAAPTWHWQSSIIRITIAEQMGYEVFEINAESRRSSKDITPAVGEMTSNSHLVALDIMAPPASAKSLFLEKTTISSSNTETMPEKKKKKLSPSLRSPATTA
ncbi:hypothetical protein MBANPS3_012609, partial [Mucor bainieri]